MKNKIFKYSFFFFKVKISKFDICLYIFFFLNYIEFNLD